VEHLSSTDDAALSTKAAQVTIGMHVLSVNLTRARGEGIMSAVKKLLRGLGKLALWSAVGLAAYLALSNVQADTRFWIIIFIVAMAVNYEIQTIKEKPDWIQGQLDDLGERLPPRSDLEHY
jgi:hypothetical protein